MRDARTYLDEGLELQKRGMMREALEHYEGTSALTRDPGILAEAMCRAAEVYRAWSKWEKAVAAARKSAALAQKAADAARYVDALNAEAIVYQERGQFAQAQPVYEQILSLTTEPRRRGVALQNLGSIAAQRGDLAEAERLFEESSRCFAEAQYVWGEAFALNNFAAAALDRGDLRRAEEVGMRAIEAAKKVGDLELLGIAAMNVAEALAGLGELAEAERFARVALDYFAIAEAELRRVQCLGVLGDISARRGNQATAVRYYREGIRLAERIGAAAEVAKIEKRLGDTQAPSRPVRAGASPVARGDATPVNAGGPYA